MTQASWPLERVDLLGALGHMPTAAIAARSVPGALRTDTVAMTGSERRWCDSVTERPLRRATRCGSVRTEATSPTSFGAVVRCGSQRVAQRTLMASVLEG